MSQIGLMEYFDANEGKYFQAKELEIIFNLNKSTIQRQLKKILKREEYIAIIKKREGVKYTLYYGARIK